MMHRALRFGLPAVLVSDAATAGKALGHRGVVSLVGWDEMLKSTCVPSGLCAERVSFTGRGRGLGKITLSDIKRKHTDFLDCSQSVWVWNAIMISPWKALDGDLDNRSHKHLSVFCFQIVTSKKCIGVTQFLQWIMKQCIYFIINIIQLFVQVLSDWLYLKVECVWTPPQSHNY